MNHNKLLVVFPDGVGIRNYLYSGIFDRFSKDVCLFHNFSQTTINYLKGLGKIADDVSIPDYIETIKEKFLRELISLLRLKYNTKLTENTTLMGNWKTNHQKFSNRIFYKAINTAALFFSSYSAILKLERQYQKAIRNNSFYHEVTNILKELNPASVFCSHQRGLKMATIFAAANDLGIPTSTVIYSWDNLPKAKLALRANQYLVWSQYMKEELSLFYPEIPTEKIVISGTPQFSFYANPGQIIKKEVFFEKYGLNPNKRTICFSGDDELTSPDDPKYLEDIAEALEQNGLRNDYQILFRRCPIDFSGRYDAVIQKYSDLIKEAPPLWNFEKSTNWTTSYPVYEDVALLVSTVFYCDLVINIGSTMAFDFAMFDKPCLFINYDQEVQHDNNWSVDTIYRFQHFRSMGKLNAVGWIDSKSAIASLIKKAIETPEIVGSDRQLWVEKVVFQPLNPNFDQVNFQLCQVEQ